MIQKFLNFLKIQKFPKLHLFLMNQMFLNYLMNQMFQMNLNYQKNQTDDLAELGLVDDDLVRIASPHAELIGVVSAAPDVRPGVVSMAHSWGSSTGTDEKVRDIGAPTNRLIDVENGYCPISGQAIQSAIPVSVEPVG